MTGQECYRCGKPIDWNETFHDVSWSLERYRQADDDMPMQHIVPSRDDSLLILCDDCGSALRLEIESALWAIIGVERPV